MIKAPIIIEENQNIPITHIENEEPFDESRGFVIVLNSHSDGTYTFRKAYVEEKEESDIDQAIA